MCSINDTKAAAHLLVYGSCKGGGKGWRKLQEFIGAPQGSAVKKTDTSVKDGTESGKSENYEWRMDENCKFVPNDSAAPICGFAGISWSPISLVFDTEHNIDQNITVVNFRLSADETKGYSLWKGSEKAPLLVYDPAHSGDVTSASQLFGNMTFGGVVSSPEVRPVGTGSAWRNGFEALALMDSDKNGRVETSELLPLALWFDKNRDAKVDKGELKSLQSEGVTALFYQNPSALPGSKDMELLIGFERVVNGEKIIGRSVDWYTDVFSSAKEAGDALLAMADASPSQNFASNHLSGEWLRDPGAFQPNKPKDHAKDVGGFWVWWQDKDELGVDHPGGFVLNQGKDGTVKGFSVVESVLAKNSMGHRAAVRAYPTIGTTSVDGSGATQYTFSVHDQFGKAVGSNKAELSKDGLSLNGTTEQKVEFMKDGKWQSASVSYSWRASKFTDIDK
jgi:hypothetical protein